MTLGTLLRKPGAWLPLAMSLTALLLVLAIASTIGVTHRKDEGAPARIFQLLLLLQVPVAMVFAATWLPRALRPALLVLLLQVGAALLAVATVVWLER